MTSGAHKYNKKAHEFLKKHPVGVLATVNPDGDPHGAVIYFAAKDASNIIFVTKSGTKKADNLKHNKHAVLVAYEPQSQTTVQVTGEVIQNKDHVEVNKAFSQILDASIDTGGGSVPPISKLDEGEYVAYTLRPKQVRMASFKHQKSGEYEDVFEVTSR